MSFDSAHNYVVFSMAVSKCLEIHYDLTVASSAFCCQNYSWRLKRAKLRDHNVYFMMISGFVLSEIFLTLVSYLDSESFVELYGSPS